MARKRWRNGENLKKKQIWTREQLFRYDKNFQHSPLFGFCGCGTELRFCHRQWREGRTVKIKCSDAKLFIHAKYHQRSWIQVSTTENPGTGPPIEDGLPVGPTLGAVLSKFCYVVLVSKTTMVKTGVLQTIMKMHLRWAMCLALAGSCSRSTVATTPQRSRSTSSTSRHLLQPRSPDVQLNDFMTSVSYLHCQP